MCLPARDAFSSYHPIVIFLYFSLVLLFSVCLMHPVCLLVSLSGAMVYGFRLRGRSLGRLALLYLLPMALLAVLVNAAFNHEGATLLAYFPSGNPLTLESLLYGLAAAGLLAAVIGWFLCLNVVLTADKFIYLFGRLIPALSLVLSMTLRLVPLFKDRFKVVAEAQRGIGRDVSQGSLLRRTQKAITILSIMVTWSLENAIETADSMKSRGYGLPGRTAFSIYRWAGRDQTALIWLLFSGAYVLSGWISGSFYWRYYPVLAGVPVSAFSVSFWLVYLALCLTPVLIGLKEDRRWRALTSKT